MASSLVLLVLCDCDDIVVGSPYINRPDDADQTVVGLFLEALPMRLQYLPSKALGPVDMLQQTKSTSLSALTHAIPWTLW